MIPRTPVFHGDVADDAAHETAIMTIGDKAKAAITHHTECVRQWLAAPIHDRPYFSGCIKAAWEHLHTYGIASQSTAATAANGLMRAQNKLRGCHEHQAFRSL